MQNPKHFLKKILKQLNPTIPSKRVESISQSVLQKLMKTYSISEFLPYEAFHEGVFLNQDALGACFDATPIMGFSEESHNIITGLFQYVLPEEANIQFLLQADPFIGDKLTQWGREASNAGTMLEKLTQYRVDTFKNLASLGETPLTARNFRLMISVTVPYTENEAMDEQVQRFNLLLQSVQTTFEQVNIQLTRQEPIDLIQFFEDMFATTFQENEASHSDVSYSTLDPIRLQMPVSNTQMHITPDCLRLNDNRLAFKTFNVTKYPDHWHQGLMGDLIGDFFQKLQQIPTPFFLHYGVHIPKQTDLKFKFHTKLAHFEKQAETPMYRLIPQMKYEMAEFMRVREQLGQNHRFVRTSMMIGLLSETKSLAPHEQSLMSLYRSKGFELKANHFLHLQGLFSMLPMSFSPKMLKDLEGSKKLKTTLSSESANLMPVQGEWYGNTGKGGMLLLGVRGQVTLWTPFNNNAGNYNVSVVGRSGSGKSVFMQELMTTIIRDGGRVFTLDVGRSFQKTCLLLKGQFMEFTPKVPLVVNPFSNLPFDDQEALEDALSIIKSVIITMAAPNESLSDLEISLLEQACRETVQRFRENTNITKIAEHLSSLDDVRAKDLGIKLYPFTNKGIYGRFFEGKSQINFDNPLVVIEFEELKERKDLQKAIIQMVIVQITTTMFEGDRSKRFGIVIDEAWDMLKGQQAVDFIETLARRIRKYGGSLIVGTQSVNDFYQTPGALAAFENSDWLCCLSQKDESINKLKSEGKIHLDPFMEKALRAVSTRSGQYAEVLIKGPEGWSVNRLVLDPFSKILYSTKAEEYTAVKRLHDRGIPMEQAVEYVAGLRSDNNQDSQSEQQEEAA